MGNLSDNPVTKKSPRYAMDEWLESLDPDQLFTSKDLYLGAGVSNGAASGYLYDLSVKTPPKIETLGKKGRHIYYKTNGFVRDTEHRYIGERGGYSRSLDGSHNQRKFPKLGQTPVPRDIVNVVTLAGEAFTPEVIVPLHERLFEIALKAESGADVLNDLIRLAASILKD